MLTTNKINAPVFRDAKAVNVSGRLERLPMTSYQRRVFAAVATAWLADQVNVALLVFLVGPIAAYFHLTKVQIGLLASMTFLGQLIGNLVAGYISDRMGRRYAFQLTMLIWGMGSFLAAGATGIVTLMVFRLIIGIGVGGEAPVAQAILSEIIPADKRGFYISFMEGFWAVGFVISGLLSYTVLPYLGWRGVFVAVGILSLVIFWARRIIFESPRWLVDQGRYDEADMVLTNVENEVMKKWGKALPPPKQYIPETSQSIRNPFHILFTHAYLRSTIMLAGLWFFALLGYFGLTSWLAVILTQHGFSVIKSIGFVSLITIGGIPGFFAAGLLLERLGRKITTALFLIMSAVLAYIYGHSISAELLFVSGFFMQFFMFGMWCCLYAYTPELYPTRARSTGSGVASAFGRVGAILGPIVVGFIISGAGQGAVFSLGAVSFVIAAALVLIFGIETRGRVLEDISRQEEIA
ncbi:MFS transporter [Acidiphilium sp. AL]|uniref:MFS transporter n=1 Tax=Acidiphilium iwatense TaxID=768198 RepID=A0ABS9E0P1_9PROT|nr:MULTISPECIES: MFS transporter [Acidiphilium]MCF3948587.1 MFS transporter [Acidiphilium iwatense]MCU4161971.1 MFS transporter [Acidiphilium sp. AL]